MNILIVGIVDTFAGGTMSLINLCHSLQKYEKTTVKVFGLASTETEGLKRIKKELQSVNIDLIIEPAFYFFKTKNRIISKIHRLFSIILNIFKLRRYIKEMDITVLHTYDAYANVIGTVAAKFSGIKLVYTAHLASDIDNRFNPVRPKFLLRQADTIITTCKDYIRVGLECGLDAKKITNIYTGVRNFNLYGESEVLSFSEYQLSEHERRSIVALVGRFDSQKGHEILLEALKRNKEDFRDVLILFVGDTAVNSIYTEKLRNTIQANELSEIVKITGVASSINKLLQISDVIILPSLYESVPMILLEAMNAEKPIVASNIGGIPELVKHNETGYLFDLDDVDALAKQISYLILNPDVAEMFAINGKKLLEKNFSLETMGEKHMAVYRGITSK